MGEKAKKILVTGITGLLGTNLANQLIGQNYHVRGISRKKSRYKGKQSENLQIIETSPGQNCEMLMNDIDVVVHIAAETSMNIPRYEPYYSVNYKTTRDLYEAAVQHDVKKFIFISTANTIAYGTNGKPGTEENPISKPFNKSFYARSKLAAEKYLLANQGKTEVTILNPTFMLGAWDNKPGSGKIIQMAFGKKLVFYPPGGKNFVHVMDVVSAIIKCIEQEGLSGNKYLIANENLTYREFFLLLSKVTAYQQNFIPIPGFLLLLSGYFGEFIRMWGVPTNLSQANMRSLCINTFYSNQKSQKNLGLSYRPVEEAIADAVNYFFPANRNDWKVKSE